MTVAVAVGGVLVGACGDGGPDVGSGPSSRQSTTPAAASATSAAAPATSADTGAAPAPTTAPSRAEPSSTASDSTDPTDVTSESTQEACAPPAHLVASAVWVEAGGRDSLEVTPTPLLRDCWLRATGDAGWDEVVALASDADQPGMREQYLCHLRFAPRKEVWHLEPWRPEVTAAQMVRSACNPGGADPDFTP